MHPHEEYSRRHNLNIPIICYDKKSSVFLRADKLPAIWNVLNIKWYHLDQSHPGFYQIELLEPIHNSLGKSCFAPIKENTSVHWDDYYNKMIDLAYYYKAKKMRVVPAAERMLSAWQMFLIIYDGWLAVNMHADFFGLVEQSTCPDLDTNTRTIAFRKAYKLLAIKSASVYNCLEDEIMPLVRGHAPWLERLING